MITTFPHDPKLKGLQGLSQDDLVRITGAASVEVLRLRHHPGLRAALHVALGAGAARPEGVIWFVSPEKLSHLRAKRPDLRVDEGRSAAFEAFPMDHRLPELAKFLRDSKALAPLLIGGSAKSAPRLVRYRPGLSATFHWVSDAGEAFFVKVARRMDATGHAREHDCLRNQIEGGLLGMARISGLAPERGIIAYAAAPGECLEDTLARGVPAEIEFTLAHCHEALQILWACTAPELSAMSPEDYFGPARRAAALIRTADDEAGRQAESILSQSEQTVPALRHVPIHADLKPDHLFVEASRVTMIDTESMKRGDPDFDLALLDARLALGPKIGAFSTEACTAARGVLQRQAGPDFHWFHRLAYIQAAKFLAQRDGAAARQDMLELLAAC